MELIKVFDDEQVYDQVEKVTRIHRRSVEEAITLGEMLVSKKKEKEHGTWIPFLEYIGLPRQTAHRFMKAYDNKDNFVDGMTLTELAGESQMSHMVHLTTEQEQTPKEKKEPPPVEVGLLNIAKLCKRKIENDYGILYWKEFLTLINTIKL